MGLIDLKLTEPLDTKNCIHVYWDLRVLIVLFFNPYRLVGITKWTTHKFCMALENQQFFFFFWLYILYRVDIVYLLLTVFWSKSTEFTKYIVFIETSRKL